MSPCECIDSMSTGLRTCRRLSSRTSAMPFEPGSVMSTTSTSSSTRSTSSSAARASLASPTTGARDARRGLHVAHHEIIDGRRRGGRGSCSCGLQYRPQSGSCNTLCKKARTVVVHAWDGLPSKPCRSRGRRCATARGKKPGRRCNATRRLSATSRSACVRPSTTSGTARCTSRRAASPLGPLAAGERLFDIEFDLVDHKLRVRTDGRRGRAPFRSTAGRSPSSIANLGGPCVVARHRRAASKRSARRDSHRRHSVPRRLSCTPPTIARRFDAFWTVLWRSAQLFEEFRARFVGKQSPVHFFWGSFDLALTRFSGRRAPPRPGADAITREAYSHECWSGGFWPGDARFEEPAFYTYAAPPPAGFAEINVEPAGASLARRPRRVPAAVRGHAQRSASARGAAVVPTELLRGGGRARRVESRRARAFGDRYAARSP